MYNSFFYVLLFIFIFTLFITIGFCCFAFPSTTLSTTQVFNSSLPLTPGGFIWPTPGYTIITSPFGLRKAPTAGASTFHAGIDIGASSGCNLFAICSGEVAFCGWNGSGGYTITIKNNNLTISYCHVSSNFLVHIGDIVSAGQQIGYVGPKNVYEIPNNPYKDSKRKPN